MNNTIEIKERPILFSAPMVRAILEGRKTQTRRVLKQKAIDWLPTLSHTFVASKESTGLCPYGYQGDRLWVRETFCWPEDYSIPIYRTDGEEPPSMECWKPSIFMPRAASRILLEITDVRVERLWDISEDDAMAEGVQKAFGPNWVNYADENYTCGKASVSFISLWEKINGAVSVAENPFVWAITFKRIKP